MQNFMVMLLMCSFTLTVIALFYMAVTPLLAKRYSVKGCYYAWLVLVIGLIIPFRPQFPNALFKVDMQNSTAAPIVRVGNGSPGAFRIPADPVLTSTVPGVSLWQIAAAIWIAGMLIFLFYHVIKHCRFLKLTSRWSENVTEEKTLTLFRNLKVQMGLTHNINLQVCDSIGSPMLIGFVRPCILLPKAEFAEDEFRFILQHELIHYKRRDLWYKCLLLIANAVHWFNPFVYLMAKAIDVQCEMSCDEEVVRGTGADTRQYYCETIISVIRYQSKRKTALSTHFYGGKKGMKDRIFSIMDMSKKRAGLSILCGVIIFTFGMFFAFSAKAETQEPPTSIQEEIQEIRTVSPDSAFAYKFLPDPETYSMYSAFGIEISDDGERLLYNGQRVRLFVDEYSDSQAFFLDEEGALDLSVTRDASGNITGMKPISQEEAREYCSAFYASDVNAVNNTEEAEEVEEIKGTEEIGGTEETEEIEKTVEIEESEENRKETAKERKGTDKYEQYVAYGVTLSTDGNILNYNGQRVKLFADMLSDGSFETYWYDQDGTVSLSVVRDTAGEITDVVRLSEEQAEKYSSALKEYEENILDALQ